MNNYLIYIYNTNTQNPRKSTSIKIPKNNDQIFDHGIVLYDKGTRINDTGPPNIIFGYRNLYKYKYKGEKGDEILSRSISEIFFTTEFFSDILELAKLIGPFEEE